MKARVIIAWVMRLALAGLFLVAAVAKLRDPSAFAREIANYQLLPALAPHFAAVLPATELVAALALLAPDAAWRRAGALTIIGLLATFLVGIGSVLIRGVNIDCGCFGAGSGPVTWLTVARNVGLAAIACYLVFEDGVSAPPAPSLGGRAVGDSVPPREGRPG